MRASNVREVREPSTAPGTEPTILASARWERDDDDSPLIADEDIMEGEGDEGNGKSVVGMVVGEVMRVKDGNEVEGSADIYSSHDSIRS
jgi:hypothetical protein